MTNKQAVFRRTFPASASQTGRLPLRTYTPAIKPAQQTASDPLIGTVVAARYRVVSIVSRGGMGVIYKCQQDQLDRIVALKLLPFELIDDPVVVDRFQREAKVLSRLSHSNLTTLYDFGRLPSGEPFFVLEYVDGETLDSVVKRERQLDYRRAVSIFVQVCRALGYAHRMGVIHRDIKPQNIMLVNGARGQDFVKVLDFGIVKLTDESRRLTRMGEVWGTAVYMSPEQCSGQSVDPRSDVFSVGSVLYECLAGRHAFNGKNLMQIMTRLMNEPTPSLRASRPDLYIPTAVEEVVLKAMQKQPKDRFNSMEEMAEALQQALARSVESPPQSSASTIAQNDQRHSHKISSQMPAMQASGIIPQTTQQPSLQEAVQLAEANREQVTSRPGHKIEEMISNQNSPGHQSQPTGQRDSSAQVAQEESSPPEYGYSRAPSQAPPSAMKPGRRPTPPRNGQSYNVQRQANSQAKLLIFMALLAVSVFAILVAVIKVTQPQPSAEKHAQRQSALPPASSIAPQQSRDLSVSNSQSVRLKDEEQPQPNAAPTATTQVEKAKPKNLNSTTANPTPKGERKLSTSSAGTTGDGASENQNANRTAAATPNANKPHRRKHAEHQGSNSNTAGSFDEIPRGDSTSTPTRDDQTQWWRFKQRLESAGSAR